MSNFTNFEFAPPKSWEQFEELCADLFSEMWSDPGIVRYGRAGQQQNGIDIIASHGGIYPVGLQCKKRSIWPVKKLTLEDVKNEIELADSFNPKLEKYYILTTALADAKLQINLVEINLKRRNENKFEIIIYFWDQLASCLAKYPIVANKHYNLGGGFKKYEPLLVTWFIKNMTVDISEDMFLIELRELKCDLKDYPTGLINIRLRESDELLIKIKENSLSSEIKENILSNGIEVRNEKCDLREKLQKNIELEKTMSLMIKSLLINKYLKNCMDLLDFNKNRSHVVIKRIIELKLNYKADENYMKISLSPPELNKILEVSDARFKDLFEKNNYHRVIPIKLHIPSEFFKYICERENEFKKENNGRSIEKLNMELPYKVLVNWVYPLLIIKIFNIMEEFDIDIKQIERIGYLNISDWKYELY